MIFNLDSQADFKSNEGNVDKSTIDLLALQINRLQEISTEMKSKLERVYIEREIQTSFVSNTVSNQATNTTSNPLANIVPNSPSNTAPNPLLNPNSNPIVSNDDEVTSESLISFGQIFEKMIKRNSNEFITKIIESNNASADKDVGTQYDPQYPIDRSVQVKSNSRIEIKSHHNTIASDITTKSNQTTGSQTVPEKVSKLSQTHETVEKEDYKIYHERPKSRSEMEPIIKAPRPIIYPAIYNTIKKELIDRTTSPIKFDVASNISKSESKSVRISDLKDSKDSSSGESLEKTTSRKIAPFDLSVNDDLLDISGIHRSNKSYKVNVGDASLFNSSISHSKIAGNDVSLFYEPNIDSSKRIDDKSFKINKESLLFSEPSINPNKSTLDQNKTYKIEIQSNASSLSSFAKYRNSLIQDHQVSFEALQPSNQKKSMSTTNSLKQSAVNDASYLFENESSMMKSVGKVILDMKNNNVFDAPNEDIDPVTLGLINRLNRK